MRSIAFYQVLCVVLALFAGALGAWCVTHYFSGAHSAPSLHQMIEREFDLTAEQRATIAEIEQRYQARRAEREAEMQAANARLAAAIDEGKAFTPEVQVAIEDFHVAMGHLQRETIISVLEIRDVLTPEQQVRFDATITASLTDPEL
jgi:Spy/CpxP family protein refolding chaperone